MVEAYGLEFPDGVSALDVEVYCYFMDDRDEGGVPDNYYDMELEERREIEHRLSKLEHFWNIVDMVWGDYVVRNPWLDRKLSAMIKYEFCSLAGCASSGKSYGAALYALVQFICDPHGSLVLITSTSIEGARIRVWKTVNDLWSRIPMKDGMGQMVHSKCRIRGFNEKGEPSDNLGLQIIAAGSGSSEDAYEKLVGLKASRLYLIADELPHMPIGVIQAARGNLVNGSEDQPFKMISMGNPSLLTDPFGIMSKPKDGWKSVHEGDMEWETERGVCIRFDAEQSPNIVNGDERYPWLPKRKMIDLAKKDYGERSLEFYRQYKAFWYRDAATETIYSESDIIDGEADRAYDKELDGDIVSSVMVGGADPAFTQGGDLFPLVAARVIESSNGKTYLEVTGIKKLEDALDDGLPRSQSCVKQLEEMCSKDGISPTNFGYDATGAGIAFADIVAANWSSLPIPVQFGGAASDFAAGINDTRPAKEVYANRVSELWVRAKGMLREGMIRGLPPEIIGQMVKRRWNTKSARAKKIMVESKVDMKAREGESPDWADAFFVMLEVAVYNGLIVSSETVKVQKRASPMFKKNMEIHNIDKLSDNILE